MSRSALIALLLLIAAPAAQLAAQQPCPKCGKVHTPVPDPAADQPIDLLPGEINRDPAAFRFARAEALRVARYVNGTGIKPGHHMGVAPGCRAAGTGNGYRPGVPVHCRPYPDSRIVARACVYYRGRYCWAAMYR